MMAKNLDRAIDQLETVTSVYMTHDQMLALLNKNPSVRADVQAGRIDTQTREALVDALSQELIGQDWPCYGHAADFDDFVDRFESAARKAGYRLIE